MYVLRSSQKMLRTLEVKKCHNGGCLKHAGIFKWPISYLIIIMPWFNNLDWRYLSKVSDGGIFIIVIK